MAYIISFVNEKGGAGKTNSSVNSASCLAAAMKELSEDAKPVLLIDADPAAGATIDICPTDRVPKKYYSDMIIDFCQKGEFPNIQDSIVPTNFEGLHIMPANSKLGLATEIMHNQEIAREKILSQIFKELPNFYSWVFVDVVGVKWNTLALNVLALDLPMSKSYVVIPCEAEKKNVASYYNVKSIINTINSAGINKTSIIAVFYTKIDERRTYDKVMLEKGEELFGKEYLPCPIHTSGAICRLATEQKMPIAYVSPKSRIAKDYERLCSGIVERILGGEFDG